MSEPLTDKEKRHVLAMDATLAMATMASMARFINQAKSDRDVELIARAVMGFAVTAVLSLRASTDKSLPAEDPVARAAALQAYVDVQMAPMVVEIIGEDIKRISRPKSERDTIIAQAQSILAEVKH